MARSAPCLAALVLVLLDVSDLYSKYFSPWIGPDWSKRLAPYTDTIDAVMPYLIALIVAGAVFYTFWEVDREVARNPKTVRTLKKFYSQSAEMLRRTVKSDHELGKLNTDARNWYQAAEAWIGKNMEQAALARFQQKQMSLPYQHGATLNDEHQITLNGINIYHRNLQAIIESDVWR